MLARFAAFIIVSIVLSGCSGSESSGAKARSVVQQYYTDLEDGKGAAVCALLTAVARDQVVRPLRIFHAHLRHDIDCTLIMTSYAKAVASDAAALHELESTRIGGVTLTGDRATVAVTGPNGPRQVPLVKTASGWRIDRLIIRVQRPIGG